MNNTITFDTLKFVQTLEDAGIERRQAAAIAEAVRGFASHGTANLATKSDLRELELRVVIKLGALMVVLMGLMLAVLKL